MNKAFFGVLSYLILLALSPLVLAEIKPQVAIEGYSPVSYFTKNKAEKGNPKFAVTHKEKTYHLTSAEQVKVFQADPDKYTPKFGQYCAYSLTLGRRMSIDPTSFKVLGDDLLLYHKSEEADGRAAWEKSDDEPKLVLEAQKQFTLLRFN